MGIYDRHAVFYDAIYAARDRDPAADVDLLLGLADERGVTVRSVLDVACGTGLHAAELAERLDVVVGVDLSAEMLAIARERAPELEFHEGDYRTFDVGRRFDLVTCLFSAIGHVDDEDGLRRAMARMAAHVAPGGLLLVEAWLTPDEVIPGGKRDAIVVETEDGHVARLGSSLPKGDVLEVQFAWAVSSPAGCEVEVERQRTPLFTADQYVDAVAAAGLEAEWIAEPSGLSGRPLVLGGASVA